VTPISALPAGTKTEVGRLANGLSVTSVSTKDAAGNFHVNYFVKDSAGTYRPLPADTTGPLAQTGLARQVLTSSATNGTSVIIIDVNHLGKVNYMPRGLAGGDDYLGAVAQIANNETKGQAIVGRFGGDEYAIVTKVTDPVELQALTQRISDQVVNSAQAKAVFRAQKETNRYIYHSLRAADSYDMLPTTVKNNFTAAEVAAAQANWGEFKPYAMSVVNKMIYESASYQPSASIGSAIVGTRTSEQAFAAANAALNDVKITYKDAVGLDTSKYTGRESFIPPSIQMQKPRDLKAKPQTLAPY
jgi:GGDEF domain-containing protein